MLALYDQLALRHLKRWIPFRFVLATSFTTYALSHNIGASVFSGAVVRYRAYTSKGLSVSDVALLIAFCSFTFALGVLIVSAVSLLVYPEALNGYFDVSPIVPRGSRRPSCCSSHSMSSAASRACAPAHRQVQPALSRA